MAANQAQVSSGSEKERRGLFTYHVLKGLHGSADADGNGRLTVGELHGYVRDNVWREAGLIDREQEPTLMSGDVERVLVEYGR